MNKIKILYVEDEPFLAKIVSENLQTRGYEIKLLTHGGGAGEAFLKFGPDICVLDVMLPQKDGFSVAQDIRQQSSSIPILFVTAKNQTEDVLKGFESGGNDYIRKPFSLEELVVRIENLLQLSTNKAAKITNIEELFSFGAFTLLPLQMELKYKNNPSIKLSYREIQILELLVHHQNEPLDRRVLLKKVWGDDSFFNSRNLDVYIRKLRNYLAADEKVKIITLKGIGYLFSVAKC